MKVRLEFDTDSENFDRCEYNQVMKASDMASVIWDMEQAVRCWYKYPTDTEPLTADTLHDKFYEILTDNNINIDDIME